LEENMKKIGALISVFVIALMGLFPFAVHSLSPNLIANPSVETASGSLPSSWSQGKWGTNTTAFTYKTDSANSGTHSLYVNTTSYTSGDAKWYFNDVAVQPNQQYSYSEFYKSNVATEIDAQYTDTSGKLSYAFLAAPAANSSAWSQLNMNFTTPANVKTMTIFHVINKVGWLQTDDYSLTSAVAATPPTVSFTAPAANTTLSGTQTLSANASDASGVAGVQFKVDNTNIGAEDTTAPYSVNWDSKSVGNGTHSISATARNTSGLVTTVSENVNIQNALQTVPTVSVTVPSAGATVGGNQTVTASASDTSGIASVQFKLDGTNLGNAVTVSPYSVSWDSTKASNGNHILTAVATNTSGVSATSAGVSVNVQNTVVTPPSSNLIPNSSLEAAQDANTPQGWIASNWGSNTSQFSYLNTGHSGGRSIEVQSTAYTNGAANWFYADVPVTLGKTYQYQNWYQSNVDTEVDAEVQMSDGTTQYVWLGNALTNTSWTKFTATYTAPAGAKSMAIYQILAKKGYLITDDYSLTDYNPQPFKRALISITFDDGWTNQYQNAFPKLQQYGLPATFYIISGELTDQPDYMSKAQVVNLHNAGEEIASHSVSHPDLTTVSATKLQNEMKNSQTTLQNAIGVPITDFAYPFGAYNSKTIAVGKQYYQSQRSVVDGLNTRDNFDLTQLKIHEVDSNITTAQVQVWIDQAIADKAWLILVYHEIATTPSDPTDALYTTQPSDLNTELAYIKNTNATVVTVNQAINEIAPQL
jgi:peptidoglycan/xylan/chitin deacetylase (PgdA/CDA1 family)